MSAGRDGAADGVRHSASARVRGHLRSNVVGYVAVFLAITGVTWAAAKAPKNSVVSKSIANGQVKTADLRDGAVTGAKVQDDSLTGAEIDEASLSSELQRRVGGSCPAGQAISSVGADGNVTCAAGADLAPFQRRITGSCAADSAVGAIGQTGSVGCNAFPTSLPPNGAAGGDLTGTYPGPEIAANAITGTEVDEVSLDIGVGRTDFDATCADDDGAGTICASVSFDLPRASHVLLLGDVAVSTTSFDDTVGDNAAGDDVTVARATCGVTIDAFGTVTNRSVGEFQVTPGALPSHPSSETAQDLSISFVPGPAALDAGPHTYNLRCTEVDGDVEFSGPTLTVVALDDS